MNDAAIILNVIVLLIAICVCIAGFASVPICWPMAFAGFATGAFCGFNIAGLIDA